MKITRLELANFKRFTQLTLDEIPDSARLVLLIGANGSGKSSVFDAFEVLNKGKKGESISNMDSAYFRKDSERDFNIVLERDEVDFFGFQVDSNLKEPALKKLNFYGRSSFRQVSRLTRTSLGTPFNVENDADRPQFFIDRDERFENDIENITGIILRDFFRTDEPKTKTRERFIDPINRGLSNIFGGQNGTKLELIEIIPPLDGKTAQVTFRKGLSEFHYNQLGAGEKEVINILINITSRKEALENAIVFFDEIDLHLNTQLQYNLLKELLDNWIPKTSQFWTASHSLGFIEFARQQSEAVIFDFDDLNFDLPQTLLPVPKDNPDVYEIAVGKEFLPALLADKKLCFVENQDRDYYGSIGLPNLLFAAATNRNNVYHKVLNDNKLIGIVDRDFLTDDDIILIRKQYKNLFLLPYYSIENLFYHPDNLEEYNANKKQPFDKQDYIKKLIAQKEIVKNTIMLSLSLKRTEYPYFGEQNFAGKPAQNRFKNKGENSEQTAVLAMYLNAETFEDWYKIFPMKTYATEVSQRQHIPKSDLVKTKWFKKQIENMFAK